MRAMANDGDEGETWIDGEIDNTGFGDARLGSRLRKLMCCWDCQEFRVRRGIMGNKETHYVTTESALDTERQ